MIQAPSKSLLETGIERARHRVIESNQPPVWRVPGWPIGCVESIRRPGNGDRVRLPRRDQSVGERLTDTKEKAKRPCPPST